MRIRSGLALVIVAAVALPPTAGAGGPAGFFFRGSFSGGEAAVAGAVFGGAALGFAAAGETYRSGWREDPALLIVDAGELVARALPVPLGPHVVHVEAPGFRPRAWQFVADGSFPIRVRASLSAE